MCIKDGDTAAAISTFNDGRSNGEFDDVGDTSMITHFSVIEHQIKYSQQNQIDHVHVYCIELIMLQLRKSRVDVMFCKPDTCKFSLIVYVEIKQHQ